MLEDSIYRFEQSYLEETGAGNIIKGFDNYIKGATIPSSLSMGAGGGARRKAQVSDADRVFSRSSVSFNRVCFRLPRMTMMKVMLNFDGFL